MVMPSTCKLVSQRVKMKQQCQQSFAFLNQQYPPGTGTWIGIFFPDEYSQNIRVSFIDLTSEDLRPADSHFYFNPLLARYQQPTPPPR